MGLTLCRTARRTNRLKGVCGFIPSAYSLPSDPRVAAALDFRFHDQEAHPADRYRDWMGVGCSPLLVTLLKRYSSPFLLGLDGERAVSDVDCLKSQVTCNTHLEGVCPLDQNPIAGEDNPLVGITNSDAVASGDELRLL
jgi:hypothetical protein